MDDSIELSSCQILDDSIELSSCQILDNSIELSSSKDFSKVKAYNPRTDYHTTDKNFFHIWGQ